jgi:hypothetical protein
VADVEAETTGPLGSGVGVGARWWSVACAAAGAALVVPLVAWPAGATTATATVTAGPLAVTAAPLRVAAGQPSASQALVVSNATGSGAEWGITAATTGGPGGLLTATCIAGPGCHALPARYALGPGPAIKVFTLSGTRGAGEDTVVLAWEQPGPPGAGRHPRVCIVSLVTGP